MKKRIFFIFQIVIVIPFLVSVSTVMGCMETLGASIVDEYPSMRQYKPAIVFTIMSGIFMINLVMATKGNWYAISIYLDWWILHLIWLLTVFTIMFSFQVESTFTICSLPITHPGPFSSLVYWLSSELLIHMVENIWWKILETCQRCLLLITSQLIFLFFILPLFHFWWL